MRSATNPIFIKIVIIQVLNKHSHLLQHKRFNYTNKLHIQTSRERPKSAPYLRLKKTRKPLFLQLETTKALKKLKIEKKKSDFFEFFFEVSGKSHSAEKFKRGDAFYLMLDALDALKMKY